MRKVLGSFCTKILMWRLKKFWNYRSRSLCKTENLKDGRGFQQGFCDVGMNGRGVICVIAMSGWINSIRYAYALCSGNILKPEDSILRTPRHFTYFQLLTNDLLHWIHTCKTTSPILAWLKIRFSWSHRLREFSRANWTIKTRPRLIEKEYNNELYLNQLEPIFLFWYALLADRSFILVPIFQFQSPTNHDTFRYRGTIHAKSSSQHVRLGWNTLWVRLHRACR